MNEIKIKKPVFITTLVVLVLVLGGLIGLAIYDTIHIRNLESRSEAFTEGMMGPGDMGGRQGMMNGEMPRDPVSGHIVASKRCNEPGTACRPITNSRRNRIDSIKHNPQIGKTGNARR